MSDRRSAAFPFNFLGVIGFALAALAGCSGDDGSQGATGSNAVATVSAYAPSTTALNMAVTGVTVASPPVVTFRVTDQNGTPVSGILPDNLRFTVAKLTPGTAVNGNLSNWQNYVLRRSGGRVQGNRETPTASNLKDNGDGTYTYTFQTDITNATCPPPATDPCNDSYGDPIDVSYDPALTHRVGIQIRRGSTNLPLANAVYTFRPSDGATSGITLRDIVKTARCNECHGTLEAHDERIDTRYCVTCHNRGTTADGQVGSQTGDMPVDMRVMIHKIHNGPVLPSVLGPDGQLYTADDYDPITQTDTRDYAIVGFSGKLSFKEVEFPQNHTNCAKCHGSGSDPETPQGDNWKNRPNMYACGACHDNVYFDASTNNNPDKTIAHQDFVNSGPGASGLVGPIADNDNSQCTSCHTPDAIATVHIPVEITNSTPGAEAGRAAYQDDLPPGAAAVTYEIKTGGVTVGGAPQRVTVVFRILVDGTPATLNAQGSASMLTNFTGGPSFYVAYAVAQDGIATPADFNVNASAPNVSLTNVWNGTQGTLSGPDADRYYTAVLVGSAGNVDIPSGATLVTVGMLNAFVQTNVPGYPGGLTLPTPAQRQAAAGYTARRQIAAREKCNACHATLGTNPTFHGGNRNDPQLCAFCHNPQGPSATRSWPARSSFFVHAIHGAAKRTVDFNWHGTAAGATVLKDRGFWEVKFPGVLNRCETCHLPGMYDFSNSIYTPALLGNLLYTYAATGNVTASFEISPWISGPQDFGARFNSATGAPAANTTRVISPIATACFACHDTNIAKAHMESMGASIYELRSTALDAITGKPVRTEQCLTCHGPGKIAAIATVHAK
jgi:OmcA/MtrC family decaheme c-type cytochrome